MAKITKEVILVEDLIKAINNLPNCPNGHSDVYDKNRLMYMAKTIPSQYADVEINDERYIDFQTEAVKRNAHEILAQLYRKHEETGEHGIYDITPNGKLGEKLYDL